MPLRRMLSVFWLSCVLLFGQAQSTSGDLKGNVVDPSGAAIAQAKLTILNAERGITRTTATDTAGEFNLPLLTPGIYKLRVEAPGFTTKVLDGLQVRVGDTVALNITMDVGNVATEIDVRADVPVIETERVQQANTIEQARIRDLPINRRNYLDFALLAPATADTSDMVDGTDYRPAQTPQSGISFGGGNGRGNGFFIDGVENYSSSGGIRPSVSQEAVQEFQINRNGFSTEFSWASGGTVNIITKSGTNDLHGNVFGFLRHRSIQARNYFDPTKSAFTRYQAGATLGAPIVKDRTFFFAAFERLGRQETGFVPILQDRSVFNTLTPSQKQLADFLGSVPIPQFRQIAGAMNSALIPAHYPAVTALFDRNSGVFPFSEKTSMVSARLDHRISDNQNLFFRANLTDQDQSNAQLGALVAYNRGRSFSQWDGTMMLNHSYLLSSRWVVETRALFNNSRIDVVPIDPNGPEVNIAGFGFFGRDIFLPSTSYERHFQVLQNWNFHSSAHDMKFGFDINPVRTNVFSETFFSGRFSFGEAIPLQNVLALASGDPNLPKTLAAALTQLGQASLVSSLAAPINALQAYSLGLPTFYQQGFGNPNWIGWARRYGMYLQDSFKPFSGFTLNLGVRWDLENNEKVIGSDYNNISPRIGFAWSPDSSGKTVIRGGYGLFYTMTNLQIPNVADTLSGKYIDQVFVPVTGLGSALINPLTKAPLTSIDLFRYLTARGILGNRPITPADIAPLGLRPGPGLPGRVEFGSEPMRDAYSQQASFEIERSFGDFAVSLGYNFNRSLGVARITGRNVYYTGQRRPDGSPIFGFINPLLLQKNIFTYDGNSFYHAGYVQVTKRLSRSLALNAHYTLSRAIDDVTDFNSDFSPNDQLNARAERGLSSFHHAHRFVLNALYQSQAKNAVLRGWNLAPIFAANSWRPFNVLAGLDLNGDNYTTNDRPTGLGRNMGQGPAYWSADLRISRRFAFSGDGRRSIEFIAEGFNLANRTNFRTVNNTVGAVRLQDLPNPIKGVRGSPTSPLAYTSAFDPRQFQFGLKINY